MHQARHRTGTSSWLIRPRALAALAVAAAGLAFAVWLPSRDDVASATVQSRSAAIFGRSAFADDFSRDHDLDRSKWSLHGSGGGAEVDDGRLVVSRLITSRQRFTAKFGHAEARIKVSRAPGVWRAFAVLDENGRVPDGTLEPIEGGIDPTSGRNFHTYVIDWTPDTVTWSVDHRPSLRLTRSEPGGALTLVLNLATDGRSPARMVVDFVQVFTSNAAPPGTSPSPSPSTSTPSESPSPSESPTASATPTQSPTATVSAWKPFTDYQPGDLVSFGGKTFRVLEAHTSLPGWEPPKLPNLFAKR